jgi:LPS O-antigen subunit length determinant protein (WzzB/FepE family)
MFKQLNYLWQSKFCILISTFISIILFISISYLVPERYVSHTIQNIVTEDPAKSSTINLPSLGGLAETAGIDLGKSNGMDIIAIETIKSRKFLKHLLTFNSVKKDLVADTDLLNASHIEIHETLYSKNLSANLDNETGLIHISFIHESPEFSKKFLELIIQEVNNVYRKEKIEELKKARQFYEAEYEITKDISLKSSITYLIEKNISAMMLANVKSEYLLKSIEDPFVPEKKYSPVRIYFVIFGFMFGFILSSIYVLFKSNFSDN